MEQERSSKHGAEAAPSLALPEARAGLRRLGTLQRLRTPRFQG